MSYAHGCADELRQACHDIRQPIAGVLALPEAASSQADLPVTDVLGVITEAVGAQQAARASDLTVLWLPAPVLVRLPRVTLRRMTVNLLVSPAAGPSGRATVEVSVRATQVVLAVKDDGPGFGLLPGGCGLGLSAMAREALEYNGRLECGRGGLGGARVSLLLPIAASRKGGRITNAARAL